MADSTDPAAAIAARLDAMVQTLALTSAVEQHMDGTQAQRKIDALRDRVQSLVARVRGELRDAAERDRIARDADQLIDATAKLRAPLGKTVAIASYSLKAAMRGRTVDGCARAMAILSDWLASVAVDEPHGSLDPIIAELRAASGAELAYDDDQASATLQAEIDADVRASLGGIFAELEIRPPAAE